MGVKYYFTVTLICSFLFISNGVKFFNEFVSHLYIFFQELPIQVLCSQRRRAGGTNMAVIFRCLGRKDQLKWSCPATNAEQRLRFYPLPGENYYRATCYDETENINEMENMRSPQSLRSRPFLSNISARTVIHTKWPSEGSLGKKKQQYNKLPLVVLSV